MSTSTLIDKINHLPAVLSKDLNEYLTFLNASSVTEQLTAKSKLQQIDGRDINIYTADADNLNKKPKLKREFGSLKGFVVHIADDFDAPLDDLRNTCKNEVFN